MTVTRTMSDRISPNSLAEAYNGFGMPLIGTIVAWIPGYYTGGGNTGYTPQLASDSVAAANAYLNRFGWHVCDGAYMSPSTISPIFNGPNQYLPNLSNERFLNGVGAGAAPCVGGTSTGDAVKGNNMLNHSHTFALASDALASAGGSQTVQYGVDAGDSYHSHGIYAQWPGSYPYGSYWIVAGGHESSDFYPDNISVGDSMHTHTANGTIDIAHTHAANSSVTGSIGAGVAPTSTDNRPNYLKCFYIMRVK